MSKHISVTWSEGITDDEARVLVQTLESTLTWLAMRHPAALIEPPLKVQLFGPWTIPALAPDKPYWGTQWYIDTSYDTALEQVIAPVFLELVSREPWQLADPHLDLALIDRDITDLPRPLAALYPERYALASSLPGSATVLSAYRLRTATDLQMQAMALARLVRHSLGHILNVPRLGRSERVQRLGNEMHCTNVCVMRDAPTIDDLLDMTLEEGEMGWPFCPLCTRDLHSTMVRYAQVWN
ncbi:MAG: hypothetical protein ACYC5M_08445 [Anaerolineae bacterium]